MSHQSKPPFWFFLIAIFIYTALMVLATAGCARITGELSACFHALDGFGSIAGVILILPIYLVVVRINKFLMK